MILSAPRWALASRIACLSEPGPLSAVLVTTNVDAGAASAIASGTTGARMKTNTNGADSNRTALLVVLLIWNRTREAFISVWEIVRVSVFGVRFFAMRKMEPDLI